MIDRKTLVKRHNPTLCGIDVFSPFSVGNGEFAFTADITGLQTFHGKYGPGMPLGTMSNWGWHTSPNPEGYAADKFALTEYESHGRKVAYPYAPWLTECTPEVKWLRENPHRLHLGMLMFSFLTPEGCPLAPESFTDIRQVLDLWTGVIHSSFKLLGKEVTVRTCCHPAMDMIAVRVASQLVSGGQVRILLHFPYGSPGKQGCDWTRPDSHHTELTRKDLSSAELVRILDGVRYYVKAQWSPEGEVSEQERHKYVLIPNAREEVLEFVCRFSPVPVREELPSYGETEASGKNSWENFWNGGGAIELCESRDIRALELERRLVLSQYLTAIQSGGSLPPQESGLVHNSWSGKFHLEMHWWHSVHFALWGRPELLEQSLSWYLSILGKAGETASRQGYKGVRWPKCVGPEGINAPCYIEPFLVWQQPHPIYYAELLYRALGRKEILRKYSGLVFETAEFMASFAAWEEEGHRYVLGPPVAPAQEVYPHETTWNPAFELAYWAYGLETAQKWRERMGLGRSEGWEHVLKHLSALPVADAVYAAAETVPDTFQTPAYITDHPTMVAPLGMLPGLQADRETMKRTFDRVRKTWNWNRTWGWDYPMLAMTAARLGEGEKAVELLMMDTPRNQYLPNGHCFQHPGLPVYLPGNGGLLTAAAMMAAGWDNGPDMSAPGFPKNGKWTVRFEDISKMP